MPASDQLLPPLLADLPEPDVLPLVSAGPFLTGAACFACVEDLPVWAFEGSDALLLAGSVLFTSGDWDLDGDWAGLDCWTVPREGAGCCVPEPSFFTSGDLAGAVSRLPGLCGRDGAVVVLRFGTSAGIGFTTGFWFSAFPLGFADLLGVEVPPETPELWEDLGEVPTADPPELELGELLREGAEVFSSRLDLAVFACCASITLEGFTSIFLPRLS